MINFVTFLLLFSSFSFANSQYESELNECLKKSEGILNTRLNGRTLSGGVGHGWDDLQSITTKPIFMESFKKCKTESTGHYLLPDNIVAVPILKVNFDQMANFYETFNAYREEESNEFVGSASGGVAWFSASASFSKTRKQMKENFVNQKSSLLLAKLHYHGFNLYQDSVGILAPGFSDRIEQISYSLSQNLSYQARYLAEMVIRDYGTHYVSSSDAGAIVEQKTFIDSNFVLNSQTTQKSVKVAAAASLGSFFKASIANDHSFSSSQQDFLKNITKSSKLETHGGPDVNSILAGNATFTIDNLVAFNFDGDWLYQVVSQRNFPNISLPILLNIQHLLKNATEMYYEKNTIHGCMDMNSPNYNFQANFDDKSCISNNDSYPFGGIYQTCTPLEGPSYRCDSFKQANTIIGAPKCDETMYEPVKIFDTIYLFESRQETHTKKIHFATFTYTVDYIDKIKVEAFWCRKKANAIISPEKGAMFGGVFENAEKNLITGEHGCPGHYQPYRIGRNTSICLSYQYAQDHMHAIPFGGFFSCQSQPSGCPEGFTQQMLPIEMSCNVFYCVKKYTVGNNRHPKLIRPPFALPMIAANKYGVTNIRAEYDGTEMISGPIQKFDSFLPRKGSNFREIKLNVQPNIKYYIRRIENQILKASKNFTASASETLQNIKIS